MTKKDPRPKSFDVEKFRELDPHDIIAQILPRGHVFHGYSSGSSERVIKILRNREYSDYAKLLGYGVDSDAELALARALATYIQRERDGLKSMRAGEYPHITEGFQGIHGHQSKFDNIVWAGDFTMFQDGDEVVARSSYGGGSFGMEGLEARDTTAFGAISLLAARYRFASSFASVRNALNDLPDLSWGQSGIKLE